MGHGDNRSRSAAAGRERDFQHTLLFHPDYTVGSGIQPDLLTSGLAAEALAG
jgi:hypothetical protein